MSLDPITAQLNRLIEGLCFPSETDMPWQVVVWPATSGAEITDAALRRYLAQPDDAPIGRSSLGDFAAQVNRRCRGYGAAGEASAQQHQQLFQYLEAQLSAVRVLRVGQVTVEVLVLGCTEIGEMVGVRTQSVET
ncbi:MAG: hypothetical protein O3A14_10520 [Cyanobacteria bacterium]|nr:hypothetical protein [Cyanobacteriota bacterium]